MDIEGINRNPKNEINITLADMKEGLTFYIVPFGRFIDTRVGSMLLA
ncbi:MAG: hypothetical protein ACFFC3_03085 [Candidatus Odinarchaeota archaeon]